MKTTFKLKEVMVPENNVIDRFEKLNAQKKVPKMKKVDRNTKSNIFMSNEFYDPTKQ